MSSNRNLLEEELKALMDVSADFARGLSTVVNRMKTIKAHLDKADNNTQTTPRSVNTCDRATSPIIFRTDRSTNVSPFRFAPAIKLEKEEEINDSCSYEQEQQGRHGAADAYEDVTQSHSDTCVSSSPAPSLNLINKAEVARTSPTSNSTNLIYIIKTLGNVTANTLPIEIRANNIEKSAKSRNVYPTNSDTSLKLPMDISEQPDTKHDQQKVDEDLLYASVQNDATCSSSASVEFNSEIIARSELEDTCIQKESIFVSRFPLSRRKRIRRTEEEKREYNRLRQARYRARFRKAKDALIQRISTAAAIHTIANNDVQTKDALILRKECSKRVYGRHTESA